MDPKYLLSALRVTKLMAALRDKRGVPQALKFLSRTPIVPAMENEIMARFLGQVLIADLVADGQRAGIYSLGKLSVESTKVPNLKIGAALTQEQLNLFLAKLEGLQILDDMFPATESRIVENLELGVRQRMEAICVAARLGSISYDRLGIKMDNVGFGMPADLNITVADEWTDAANAKPVSNILTAKRIGLIKYGIDYDRIVMTWAAFEAMIATTEFQNKSRQYLAPNVSFVNLNSENTEDMKALAQRVLGFKEVEIYDSRYWFEETDGSLRSAPFLPLNKVVLESTASDNDANVIDFANGIVTEAAISRMPGSPIQGQLPANARGPVGYQVAEHNPPSVTYFGVARGFTRRHYQQATAALTIAPAAGTGALEETIDFGEIAFI